MNFKLMIIINNNMADLIGCIISLIKNVELVK